MLMRILLRSALIVTSLYLSTPVLSSSASLPERYQQTAEYTLENLEVFLNEVSIRRSEIYQNWVRQYILEGLSEKKAKKKAKKEDAVKYYAEILDRINSISSMSSRIDQLASLQTILEMDLALHAEIDPINDPLLLLERVDTILDRFTISMAPTKKYGPATNLVNPVSNELFTDKELSELLKKGEDLSLYDPPKNNGVIDPTLDISQVDVIERYHHAKDELHAGQPLNYPEGGVAYFDKLKKTQSRPKLMIYNRDENGKKIKYKLKLAQEIHSEPTAGALASALGMYVDVTRHVKDFKVIFGDLTYEELKLDWNSYFHYELDDYIKEQGHDENGYYIIFRDGMIEARFDDDVLKRVGPWFWGSFDHKARREFRAMQIFNIWIHNADSKESENNKLILRELDGELRPFFLQHDVGYSLGYFFRERPTDFGWEVVKKKTENNLVFHQRQIVPYSGFDHITFADGKWMVRKIAQLSRKQITDAVQLGQWPNQAPYNYEQLYIEKLISRRNDLVKHFDLLGEVLPNGEVIELLPFNKEVEKEAIESEKNGVPGFSVDFSPEIKNKIINPMIDWVGDAIHDGTVSLIGKVTKLPLEGGWIGLDDGLINEVLITVDRSIVENPNPKSNDEAYLVRDDFILGYRLGYGFVLSGDVSYMKKFSLIYPVETKEEARDHRRYLVDLLKVPYPILQKVLPDGHILITEDYFAGRGRLKAEAGPISLGISGAQSKYSLGRSIISQTTPGKLRFYHDSADYNETAGRFYTKVFIAKIHHIKKTMQIGETSRNVYEMNVDDIGVGEVVSEVLFNQNFEKALERGRVAKYESDFRRDSGRISLFGFRYWENSRRLDDVDIFRIKDDGSELKVARQIESRVSNEVGWRLLSNSEKHKRQVRVSAYVDEKKNKLVDPIVHLRFHHQDANVTTKELEKAYLPFVDNLSGEDNFLGLSPSLHSAYGTWGALNIYVDLKYDKTGMAKLLSLGEVELFTSLGKKLGLSYERARTISRRPLRVGPRRERGRYLNADLDKAKTLKRALTFLKLLTKAKNAKNEEDELHYLAKALSKTVIKDGHGFDPVLLSVLNEVVGEGGYFLESFISVPEDWENKLPGRITPYNHKGKADVASRDYQGLLFELDDALEVYSTF